jgi:hypothetical protein
VSGHTPGPWHATPSPKGGHNIYDADNNVPAIARTYRIADDATVEANARLIAAAPDLLEALQIIVANARMVPDPTMDGATDCFAVPLGDIEIVAHAAIAHATGDFAARATGEPEAEVGNA